MNNEPNADQTDRSRDFKKASLKFTGFLLLLAGVYFVFEYGTYYAMKLFAS